jgi:dTDP-4-dehydrorhamnose 3,5-epimerase
LSRGQTLLFSVLSNPAVNRMERFETSLPGVFELRPAIHRDLRGFFVETYNQAKLREFGVQHSFVQDNHSCSIQGTLRGLHYQLHHPQAKLCRVIQGEALDVAVDIRIGSPSFGEWTAVLLSATMQNQIYVPPGFAHGFLALTDQVQFLYKCSDHYVPGDECGILWNDSDLAISWGVESPLLSKKDANNPRLAAVSPDRLPQYRPE